MIYLYMLLKKIYPRSLQNRLGALEEIIRDQLYLLIMHRHQKKIILNPECPKHQKH